MIMTMIMTNIHDVKARLSEYLEAAASGERVVICKRNRPVAELRAIKTSPAGPRPFGAGKGRLTVPPAFFDPLPDEVLEPFNADGDRTVRPRVAEGRAVYRRMRRTPRR